MGVNVVEREGISFTHPARFILVGTMNPEEGELRPQLLDRFGLCVEVTGLHNLQARMAVVQRRLAFEADPEGFAARWQGEQEMIRQAILSARERLPQVSYSPGPPAPDHRHLPGPGGGRPPGRHLHAQGGPDPGGLPGPGGSDGPPTCGRPRTLVLAPPPAAPTLQRLRNGRKQAGGDLPEASRGPGARAARPSRRRSPAARGMTRSRSSASAK